MNIVIYFSCVSVLHVHRLKVLVAIDGFNGLFNPTSIKTSDGNMVVENPQFYEIQGLNGVDCAIDLSLK